MPELCDPELGAVPPSELSGIEHHRSAALLAERVDNVPVAEIRQRG
jgi:hypothetical protein